MDKVIEECIVKSYFIKNRQDRILHELNSEKRNRAIWRLSHNYLDYLKQNCLIEISRPNSDYLEIARILKNHGAGDLCYVLSINTEIDGKHLNLLEALEKAVGFGLPSIVSCIPGKLAYFEAEQEYGAPPRYLLKND